MFGTTFTTSVKRSAAWFEGRGREERMRLRGTPRESEGEEKEMTIDRFEVPGLAQYSYIISSEGRSVVVDPIRDTDRYLRFLEERGLTLSSIVETHIHADFASGARALAEATGAELAISGYDEGEHYQYGMPHRSLRSGDSVKVGTVRVEALHTPGHTPEHLSFVVYDIGAQRS